MVIPQGLVRLINRQEGEVIRSDRAAAEKALRTLGIPLQSEIAEFFLNYQISLFLSRVSDEQLCDVASPTEEIAQGTQFAREVWQIPDNYVCLTSVQGEGAYLYDKASGKVWDFDLASRDALLGGKLKPRWNGFFDFLSWYLGNSLD
jgi:hypothetical protein